MDQVSRPLLIVLVAVVAVFAVWMVALRPHGSSGDTTPAAAPAPPAPQAAVPAPRVRPSLHRTHNTQTHTRHEAPGAALRSIGVHPRARPRPATLTPAARLAAVQRAMAGGKVLALLFYNPAGADDQAVKQELAAIPASRGSVFKLAVPLAELSSYVQITDQVPVNYSPTLVIVGRDRQAQEIVGFADPLEISERVAMAG